MLRLILIPFLLMSPDNILSKNDDSYFKKSETSILNPLSIRDPFKRKPRKRSSGYKRGSSLRKGDTFSNVLSLDGVAIDKIKVVGVLLGKNRRAMVKIYDETNKERGTISIKEGMFIGENNAEVKAILPGGIVLVEKIKNVYNQEEYLETILPVLGE